MNSPFDRDEILTGYLTDYIDHNLDRTEQKAFEQYLAENPEAKEFARKAKEGKRAISKLTGERVGVPENFEARLALRIAIDKMDKSETSITA